MSPEGHATESHENVFSDGNVPMTEAQIYSEPVTGFASTEDLSGDHIMTAADIEKVVDTNPDLFQFDYQQAQQDYAGDNNQSAYVDQKDPNMGAEALNPTTPGYIGFDQNQQYYPAYSSGYPQFGFSSDAQESYDGGAAQTLFQPSITHAPFIAQTPYIQQTPSIEASTSGGYGADNDNIMAGPSGTYGTNDDIMADANNFFSSTGDISFNDPVEDAYVDDDAKVLVPEKKSDKKVTSHAKGKRAAKKGDVDAETVPSATKGVRKTTRKTKATSEKNSKGENRVRKAPKNGITQGRPIPKTIEECDEADRALLEMRDADRPWAEINETYKRLSGAEYGGSTLPNRYDRMKDKFASMREEDQVLLFDAKKAIEDDFEAKKWKLIAADIRARGGESYSTEVLQRRFKCLMQKEGLVVDEGLAAKDPDFVVQRGGGEEDGDADDEDGADADAEGGAEMEDEDGGDEFLPY